MPKLGRRDTPCRKETGEIDYVESIGQVERVGLNTDRTFFVLPQIGADRGIKGKRGPHAAAAEVDPIDDLAAVLGREEVYALIEGLERQTAVVGAAPGSPEAFRDLPAQQCARRIALVLGCGEPARGVREVRDAVVRNRPPAIGNWPKPIMLV